VQSDVPAVHSASNLPAVVVLNDTDLGNGLVQCRELCPVFCPKARDLRAGLAHYSYLATIEKSVARHGVSILVDRGEMRVMSPWREAFCDLQWRGVISGSPG
jgi:hypothetical protein